MERECEICSRLIRKVHDYEHCDHVFFDGKIGCDNCLNEINWEGVKTWVCWGCHCRLYRSNKDDEEDDNNSSNTDDEEEDNN